jgi:hypothetical protein
MSSRQRSFVVNRKRRPNRRTERMVWWRSARTLTRHGRWSPGGGVGVAVGVGVGVAVCVGLGVGLTVGSGVFVGVGVVVGHGTP